MYLNSRRANEISGGVFLVGLGLCFAFGFWPWILFVIGATSIVQGLADGHGWYAFQGATWTIGIGIWALFNFNIAALFILIGVSSIVAALVRPPFLRGKPKPFVDNTLE
jgi:hypothetical protein